MKIGLRIFCILILLTFVIMSLIGAINNFEDAIDEEKIMKEVPCYDREYNEIQGLKCIDEVYKYESEKNLFALSFVTFCVSLSFLILNIVFLRNEL